MKGYIKKTVLFFYIIMITAELNSGSDFVAINIPSKLHNYFLNIINYAKNRLVSKNKRNNPKILASPIANLHITLKEIGDLNSQERQIVIKKLTKIAEQISPYDICQVIKAGRLKIDNKFIKLVLKENIWLTDLAQRVDSAMQDLANRGKIRSVKRRLDFPKHGHITLAIIENLPNNLNDKIKTIEKKFINNLNQNFLVDRFELLKSNRPQTPRVYNKKATIYLKN